MLFTFYDKDNKKVTTLLGYVNSEIEPDPKNTPGVNVEELKKLRKLIRNDSDSHDDLPEDPRKSWHKIATSVWYYANKNVGLLRGWLHDEQDTQFYYLDKKTGIMAVGWTEIDGHYYYFSEDPESDNWYQYGGEWTTRNRNDISIGSMYVNRRTPDGYYVDANGHYVESAGKIDTRGIKDQLKTQEQFLAEQQLTLNQERELENILDSNTMNQIHQIQSSINLNNSQVPKIPLESQVYANPSINANSNIIESSQLQQIPMTNNMENNEVTKKLQEEYLAQLAYHQSLVARMMNGDKAAEQEYRELVARDLASQNR